MEVINNGYVPKKRNEKKQKNERRHKKFTIDEYQLVDYDLFNPFKKSFICKALWELTSCIFYIKIC